MSKYKNFDQIINDSDLSRLDRISFTGDWLLTNYGIRPSANPAWVEQLSDVHDHDNEPKHFGRINVGSSFESIQTQLVKLHGAWHLGIIKHGETEGVIIHPMSEKDALVGENEKLREKLYRIVETGKILKPAIIIQAPALQTELPDPQKPYATLQDFAPQESEIDSRPVNDLNVKTTSLEIDLNDYL